MDNGNYLKEVGQRVRAAREKRNISQTAFSELCKLGRNNISFIENGKRNPRLLTLKHFADVLNMDVKEFL